MTDLTPAPVTVVTSEDLDSFCRKVLSVVSRCRSDISSSSVTSLTAVVVSVTSSVTKPVVVVANEIVVNSVELEALLAAICSVKTCSFLCSG